jgi:hypothetical protein
LTDPAPATTFAHLDATTVLSRGIAELGIYPAVDPLDSTSRIMDPNIIGAEHYNVARGVQKILQVSDWRIILVTALHLFCIKVLNTFLLCAIVTSRVLPCAYHGFMYLGLQVSARYHCYPWYG